MDTFWIKAIQLMMSLSILVLIHEYGHFLFARIFKTRVTKFASSSTLGLPYLNISQRTAKRNMQLVGCLLVVILR